MKSDGWKILADVVAVVVLVPTIVFAEVVKAFPVEQQQQSSTTATNTRYAAGSVGGLIEGEDVDIMVG